MLNREHLEKRAKELALDFAADISDADLAKLVEKAQARADLEARATALGVTFGATIGDNRLTARVAEAEAKRDGGDGSVTHAEENGGLANAIQQIAGQGFTVICAVAKGRRRGGRGWVGGKTDVPAEEMTEAMLDALEGDPMFQVKHPATE